jgi:hypothetical protein
MADTDNTFLLSGGSYNAGFLPDAYTDIHTSGRARENYDDDENRDDVDNDDDDDDDTDNDDEEVDYDRGADDISSDFKRPPAVVINGDVIFSDGTNSAHASGRSVGGSVGNQARLRDVEEENVQ